MSDGTTFTVLRFIGERFEGGILPVDAAKNLSAYQDILIEIAKEIWREHHPNRQRLPKNFEDYFQLRLDKVTEGSALAHMPRISDSVQSLIPEDMDFDIFGMAQEEFQRYVEIANKNGSPPDVSDKLRSRFRLLRENLSEDEILEVRPTKSAGRSTKAFRISQKTKERLLEKPEPKSKRIEGFGLVQLIDDDTKSIRIVSEIGKFNYILNWRNLREEFGSAIGALVEFDIKALTSASGSIQAVEEQYSVRIVEPNSEANRLNSRLDELGSLEAGWLNGEGKECDENSIIVARDIGAFLSTLYSGIAAFPLSSGGVQIEFTNLNFDVTVEVKGSKIRLEVLDDDTDDFKEFPFPSITPSFLAHLTDLKELFVDD